MGRHKAWRAEAKKMRRKRIRRKIAQEREEMLKEEQRLKELSPSYQALMAEQNVLETFQEEEESRQQLLRHAQWLKDEELAQIKFVERQKRQELARKEKLKQDKLIREEWEAEQKKLKAIEDEKQRIQEEKRQKEEELMKQIDDYIKKGGELPAAANVSTETNPDKDPCPFFSKTGACRFGDRCSRNHARPGMSKVLLIPSFYSHFGMDQSMADEYDTDLMLEYEDSDTYNHFKDFYLDVLPEFETYGDVVQFKVCCNSEPHLRGNVYVEYSSQRYAVQAYQKFHGRYYAGRQLNVEFTCVKSWKAALCGLFFKQRCPKGKNCNFLHVFRNPGNAFHLADRDVPHSRRRPRHQGRSRSRSPSSRGRDDPSTWRWSESPEPSPRGSKGRRRSRERQWEDSRLSRSRENGVSERSTGRDVGRSRRSHDSRRSSHRKEKSSRRRSRSKER